MAVVDYFDTQRRVNEGGRVGSEWHCRLQHKELRRGGGRCFATEIVAEGIAAEISRRRKTF
jgi:hypothetical protein